MKQFLRDVSVQVCSIILVFIVVGLGAGVALGYVPLSRNYMPIAEELPKYITHNSGEYSIMALKGGIAPFSLDIETSDNKTYEYNFSLQHVTTTIIQGQGNITVNDVKITLPKEFLKRNSTQKDAKLVTYRRDRINRDPVFVQERDYGLNVPFKSIEVTVREIQKYEDTNETIFVTFVNVVEESIAFDISTINVISSEIK